MKKQIVVKVKILTECGKHLLNEIHPKLEEGTIVRGILNTCTNAVEFKTNGADAVLWVGENCEIVRTRRKARRLPKGVILDVECVSVMGGRVDWYAASKAELIAQMSDNGWSRNEYEIEWRATDYDSVREHEIVTAYGIGRTRADAIDDFWAKYDYKTKGEL